MNGGKALNGLKFNNDLFLDEEVQAITAIKLDLSIEQRQWLLRFHLQTGLRQLKGSAGFIGRFE